VSRPQYQLISRTSRSKSPSISPEKSRRPARPDNAEVQSIAHDQSVHAPSSAQTQAFARFMIVRNIEDVPPAKGQIVAVWRPCGMCRYTRQRTVLPCFHAVCGPAHDPWPQDVRRRDTRRSRSYWNARRTGIVGLTPSSVAESRITRGRRSSTPDTRALDDHDVVEYGPPRLIASASAAASPGMLRILNVDHAQSVRRPSAVMYA